MGVSKAGTRLKTQNRGFPGDFGFSFGGRFVLFAGIGKDFHRREAHRKGAGAFWLLFFQGRRQPPPKRGSVLRPKPLKSLYAFRGSIRRVVFRGWWLNHPGILAQLFHFSGDGGSTSASVAASIAIPGGAGSGP